MVIKSFQGIVASSGDNTIITSPDTTAGPGGVPKRGMHVVSFLVQNQSASQLSIKWRGSVTGDLTPAFLVPANGGNYSDRVSAPAFLILVPRGENLILNLSGAGNVAVSMDYYLTQEPGRPE